MKKLKSQKGITLIALIITIVVLLILAAVAIGAVQDSNIIGHAQNAADAYEREKDNENAAIKDAEDLLNKYANGGNGGNLDAAALLAKFKENPEAFKHPEQSATNNDRAIGTDGTAVNMDWWRYTINENEKTIALTNNDTYDITGYIGDFNDGSIYGSIPQYIRPEGETEIYEVTSLFGTFAGCTSLTIAPTIPSSVTNIGSTFKGCTSLTTAPTIPSSVTNMGSTFFGCTSLTTAPTIPSSVTNMGSTFEGCTSLTTAPTIPSSVTNMGSTFAGCTSLTTAPTIPSSVTNMGSTFNGCTSLTTAPTIPSSVTNMGSTFNGCTSLTTAPTIPSSVTNMTFTFNGCTNLVGTLRIESSDIIDPGHINFGIVKNTGINKFLVPAGSATETIVRREHPDITIETFEIEE